MNGFILLHRCLLDKPIWFNSTPEQKTILITLLSMVTHKRMRWDWNGKVFDLQPGQVVTSLPKIVEKCGKGVSEQNVRTALARFKKLEFLTDESTAKGRLISIVNWQVYQDREYIANRQTNRCLTDDQQTPNRHLTDDQQTNKQQDNKIKTKQEDIPPIIPHEDVQVGAAENSPRSDGAQRKTTGRANKHDYTPEFETFWSLYPRAADKYNAYKQFRLRLKDGVPLEELMAAVKIYAVAMRGTPEDKILHAKTFLGPAQRYKEYARGVNLFGQDTSGNEKPAPKAKGRDWNKFYA